MSSNSQVECSSTTPHLGSEVIKREAAAAAAAAASASAGMSPTQPIPPPGPGHGFSAGHGRCHAGFEPGQIGLWDHLAVNSAHDLGYDLSTAGSYTFICSHAHTRSHSCRGNYILPRFILSTAGNGIVKNVYQACHFAHLTLYFVGE